MGKSTLMNHLIGQKISITSKKVQTTRHRVTGIQTTEKAQYIFCRYAGLSNPPSQCAERGAEPQRQGFAVRCGLACCFVLEAGRLSDADREVIALLPAHRPVILVVNKADRLKDKADMANFLPSASAEFNFTEIVSVSAKHGHRLDTLLKVVEPHLPQSVPLTRKTWSPTRTSAFWPPSWCGKTVPPPGRRTALFDERGNRKFEIEGNLRRIYAAVLVDKPGQKAILIGRDGERMKNRHRSAHRYGKTVRQQGVSGSLGQGQDGWADDALPEAI